ncbi:MAG: F420H2 dehydrogenase subunit F [Pelotomaculum sp. PtaB.Bin104]|jgi:coenzyme F420-reducing hydrogenase beta subunit|nr:MAG: F420H2 dehydrogenase subunit F [Pelotomaculum sp. PtaB.Bin104]
MAENVCTKVVANDLCSGCGICAGVCPQKTLSIQWNTYGEYSAVDQHNRCAENCTMCLQVCPFSSQAENEDVIAKPLFSDIPGIQHRSETGYYLDSYVGYSNIQNHRLNGASGGLTTWTLETLLEKDHINYAICVSSSSEREKLFTYTVCSTSEQIRACAKSCYYPVELSEVIHHILLCEGRYAVVGLPCFIKSLRLAMQKNRILRERIKYLLGLVCGQQKGKMFSEFVPTLKQVNPKNLISIQFRAKIPQKPASDYGLMYRYKDERGQNNEGLVSWTEGMDQAWCARYFTLNACNYCDDVFAELADAVFMDAWLPAYSSDWRGTSIILVRNPDIRKLLENGKAAKELCLDTISPEQVVFSQAGVVHSKREILAKRLTWASKNKRMVIPKRVKPSRLGIMDRLFITTENATMKQSKLLFSIMKEREYFRVTEFFRQMKSNMWVSKMVYMIICKLKHVKQKILS